MNVSRRGLLSLSWLGGATEPEAGSLERGPVHWLERKVRPRPEPILRSVAKVLPFSCLNQLGGFCATCEEQCPEPGAVRVEGRRPVVDPEACTGCGLCVERCPAPGGAILLVPEGT